MPSARVDNDTAIHRARRGQLIDSAIEVIAERGAQNASLSRIAAHAGVTRGVVTYHFRDRGSLFDAVVAHVYALGLQVLGDRVHTAATARDMLGEFIAGSIEFYAEYPGPMAALSSIYATTGPNRAERGEHRTELSDVREILEAGIRSGEFREFDPTIMASTIRAALDAALVRIRSGADVAVEQREVWRVFDAATACDVP